MRRERMEGEAYETAKGKEEGRAYILYIYVYSERKGGVDPIYIYIYIYIYKRVKGRSGPYVYNRGSITK
jgi:hypothetical protein